MQSPTKEDMGFLRSLYDFSFSSFVTTKIIKTLYVIITIVYTLIALLFFIASLFRGGVGIIFALVVVPLAYILYLALARVGLEVIAVVFRIAEYARDIRDGVAPRSSAPLGWAPATAPQQPFGGPPAPPPPVPPTGPLAP